MLKALNDWLPLVQAFLVPVLALGVRVLGGIRKEIHELGTTVAQMQQWREDHEDTHVNERIRLDRELDQIQSRLGNGANGKYPEH